MLMGDFCQADFHLKAREFHVCLSLCQADFHQKAVDVHHCPRSLLCHFLDEILQAHCALAIQIYYYLPPIHQQCSQADYQQPPLPDGTPASEPSTHLTAGFQESPCWLFYLYQSL
jgi:hypothetical protein